MKTKRAIIFPEIEVRKQQSTSPVSVKEIENLCNLMPLTKLTENWADFIVKKVRTRELGRQLEASARAVDAEYSELEQQEYIRFSERVKQLAEEYRAKSEQLEIEFQEMKAQAERAMIEHQTSFETYLKTSSEFKKIIESIIEEIKKISEFKEFADEHSIVEKNSFYVKIDEQYRRMIRGVEKCSKFIA